MNDRMKLVEAMGIAQPCEFFDPFICADDDYAVLEWMRNQGGIGGKANRLLFRFMIDYKIGDYARAALKALE